MSSGEPNVAEQALGRTEKAPVVDGVEPQEPLIYPMEAPKRTLSDDVLNFLSRLPAGRRIANVAGFTIGVAEGVFAGLGPKQAFQNIEEHIDETHAKETVVRDLVEVLESPSLELEQARGTVRATVHALLKTYILPGSSLEDKELARKHFDRAIEELPPTETWERIGLTKEEIKQLNKYL